jgi:hypothetical protein
MSETGPIYGIELIPSLPLDGGMYQALPNRRDLVRTRLRLDNDRVAAGFEVLTEHYRRAMAEIERLQKQYMELAAAVWVQTVEEFTAYPIPHSETLQEATDGARVLVFEKVRVK